MSSKNASISFTRRRKKALSCVSIILLFFFIVFTFSGCGKKNTGKPEETSVERDYDLFIFNGDKTIAKDFSEMCELYTKKTGVVVKCVTPGADENSMELLENYMNTSLPPSIFSLTGFDELKKWQEQGKVFDFSNASVESFKTIANEIPAYLRLSSNNVDNFGIPYTVDGYGLIVDPKMISSLFGGEYHRAILRDLENCTFEEFESFVNAVNLFLTGGSVYEFELCGHSYSVLNKKSGLSEDLNGVFSACYGDTGFVTELFNVFLNRHFTSAAQLRNSSTEEISNVQPYLSNFFRMLEVLTSCVSGKTSTIYRSTELVDTKFNSKSQAIKNFVSGASLFLIGNTGDFKSISVLDSDLASRLDFIPLKCPAAKLDLNSIDEENSTDNTGDVSTSFTESSMLDKRLNSSLAIKIPRYFVINSQIGEKELTQAQEFIAWMRTSEVANDYWVNKFGFVPYDSTDSRAIDNTLGQSLVEYLKSTKVLPFVAEGLEEKFRTSTLPNYLIKNCLNDPFFDSHDSDEFSESIMKMWNTI